MSPLEFTGERYIPGQGGAQMAYEHLHRYLFAMRWAKGKRVLDVATGSGYGAALLASVALRVCAMELDWDAVTYASDTNPSLANLFFLKGDATRIPVLTASADLVVALEILEHVSEQEALVCELARVVRPDGVVLISTPDKASYSDAREYRNPFHVREFYRDEFLALLAGYFPYVRLMYQQVRAGSLVTCAIGGQGHEVITDPLPAGGKATAASYFLALCSRGDGLDCAPALSAYMDLSDALQQEWQQELDKLDQELDKLNRASSQESAKLNGEIEALGRWGHSLEEQIQQINATLRGVLDQVEERDQTIRSLQHEKETEIAQRDDALKHLREEFEGRTRWVMELQAEIKNRDARIKEANALLDEGDREIRRLGGELARIRHALIYRILCRLRILPR